MHLLGRIWIFQKRTGGGLNPNQNHVHLLGWIWIFQKRTRGGLNPNQNHVRLLGRIWIFQKRTGGGLNPNQNHALIRANLDFSKGGLIRAYAPIIVLFTVFSTWFFGNFSPRNCCCKWNCVTIHQKFFFLTENIPHKVENHVSLPFYWF